MCGNSAGPRTVLGVTECFPGTSFESHLASEARSLHRMGIQFHLTVGEKVDHAHLPAHLSSLSIGLPLSPEMTVAQMLECVEVLRLQIRSFHVDLVHAYPYLSLIPALFAAIQEEVPFVLTLNGPSPLANCYGPVYEEVLKSLILSNGLTVFTASEELKAAILAEYPSASVLSLPHPVQPPSEAELRRVASRDRILLMGHLDSERLTGVVDFIEKARAAGMAPVDIAGDGDGVTALAVYLKERGLSNYATLLDCIAEPRALMLEYPVIAGIGNVLIEALALRRRAIAVGSDGVKGYVTLGLFPTLQATNYSGYNLPTVDASTLAEQSRSLSDAELDSLAERVLMVHSEAAVWERFIRLAAQSRPLSRELILQILDWFAARPLLFGQRFLACELPIQPSRPSFEKSASQVRQWQSSEPSQSVQPSSSDAQPTRAGAYRQTARAGAVNADSSQPAEETTRSPLQRLPHPLPSCGAQEGTVPTEIPAAAHTAAPSLRRYVRTFLRLVREQGLRVAIVESYRFCVSLLPLRERICWKTPHSELRYAELRAMCKAAAEFSSNQALTHYERAALRALSCYLDEGSDITVVCVSEPSPFHTPYLTLIQRAITQNSKCVLLNLSGGAPYSLSVSPQLHETNSVSATLTALAHRPVDLIALTPLAAPIVDKLQVRRLTYDAGFLRSGYVPSSQLALRDHDFLFNRAQVLVSSVGLPSWSIARPEGIAPFAVRSVPKGVPEPASQTAPVRWRACVGPISDRIDWLVLANLLKRCAATTVLVGSIELGPPRQRDDLLPRPVAQVLGRPDVALVPVTFFSTLGVLLRGCDQVVLLPASSHEHIERASGATILSFRSGSSTQIVDQQRSEFPVLTSYPPWLRPYITARGETTAATPSPGRSVMAGSHASDVFVSGQVTAAFHRHPSRQVLIACASFFDWDGVKCYAGGAEKYVTDLARLFQELGFDVRIVQPSRRAFINPYGNFAIEGIPVSRPEDFRAVSTRLDPECRNAHLVVASPVDLACQFSHPRIIGINHGIHWDHRFNRRYNYSTRKFAAAAQGVTNSLLTVAVDTNFINWLRTVDYELARRVRYVPNYVDHSIFQFTTKDFSSELVCLYPRRLYEARGLYITGAAFHSLLARYHDLKLVLAGQIDSEADRNLLEALCRSFPGRVVWQECPPDAIHRLYREAHIVLIPTAYSEGTSLACLEAMASNCGIIATNVGGLPNLVLHEFNGLLIGPEPGELCLAIERLYRDRQLLEQLARNAYQVSLRFSKSLWEQRWLQLLEDVI